MSSRRYECRQLICAERAIRDAERNFISLIDLLDTLVPAGFPLFLPNLDVYAAIDLGADAPREGDVVFRIAQGDNVLVQGPVHFALPMEATTNRVVLHVRGLPIPAPGDVDVSVSIEGETIASTVIRVEAPAPRAD